MTVERLKFIECPRDAMQGWKQLIPVDDKVRYINSLLKVGFDTLDCGSFVSPKAIPQMADTAEVLSKIEWQDSATRILTIVANKRGAEDACTFDQVRYLGFPFSVSPTFQQRNTNSSMEESLDRVQEIQELCIKANKELVVYISMGFGNPYGDDYDEEIVFEWVNQLVAFDIGIISLADTVGIATPEQVFDITNYLVESLPGVEVGVHLHSSPQNWKAKNGSCVKGRL